jgi:murein tripeptide amidase MpaA
MDKLIIGRNGPKGKKVVWIIARQHPGEVTSSFMIEGMINYLVSDHRGAEYLKDNVVFKIIPMINPDGVIHGNSRCELVGTDPNRRWK